MVIGCEQVFHLSPFVQVEPSSLFDGRPVSAAPPSFRPRTTSAPLLLLARLEWREARLPSVRDLPFKLLRSSVSLRLHFLLYVLCFWQFSLPALRPDLRLTVSTGVCWIRGYRQRVGAYQETTTPEDLQFGAYLGVLLLSSLCKKNGRDWQRGELRQ
jgi:hypothetical protein